MFDIVFPKGNEKDFIRMAERLGLEGLCFVYSAPNDISFLQKETTLRLRQGILCEERTVQKFKGKYLTLLEAPEDQSRLRHIIEKVRPDILFGLEFARRKDFMHHRASGLNHVLTKIAAENDISIGFDFSGLLEAKPRDRAVFIGRMIQNMGFASKFGVKTVMATFARDVWQLRAKADIVSFFRALSRSPDKNLTLSF